MTNRPVNPDARMIAVLRMCQWAHTGYWER
jgi:hypothetical protein